MKKIAALLIMCAMMTMSSMASSSVTSSTNVNAFTNYLSSNPQYSQQMNQITNYSSQYQNSMNQYNNYMKQYDNLLSQYKSMGSPANLQQQYMGQAQTLLTQATSSYNAATNYATQINGLVSGLQSSLGSQFSGVNSIAQLTSSSQSLGGVTSQLTNMASQLSSLKSMANGMQNNQALLGQINQLQGYVNTMTSQVAGMQSGIGQAISGIASGVNVNGTLNSIMGGFGGINNMMGSAQTLINGMISDNIGKVSSQMGNVMNGLKSGFGNVSGMVSGIAGQATGVVSGLTNQLGSALSSGLNNITGLGGGNGGFGNSGSGSGSGGSGGGAGFQQPAKQTPNIANDFQAGASASSSTSGGSDSDEVEEDFEGFYPDDDPDVYWVKDEEGNNSKPTCDEIRGAYGNTPVTINGACANAAYRIGYTGADMSKYFMKAVKQQDSQHSYKGDVVGYSVKGNDGTSNAMSMGEMYPGAYGLPRTFINNWGKNNGEDILIKKADMDAAVASDDGSSGFFKEEETKKVFDLQSGKQREFFSTAYKDHESALKAGACQLIAVKGGGKYNVIPKKQDGTYDIATAGATGSMSVVPERIVNARHPYAPRDDEDWQERTLLGLYNGSKSSTETCGTMELLNNKKAWENSGMGGGSVTGYRTNSDGDTESSTYYSSSSNYSSSANGNKSVNGSGGSVGGINEDYEYYKKPIIDKHGKILATTERQVIYDAVYTVIYEACNESTYNAAKEQCDKLAKLIGCRSVILPPVKPDNYLKMAYNKQDAGTEMPWIYEVSGDDFGYPDTTGSNVGAWAQGYIGLGTSWHQILPHENFKYNMPPLYHWPTKKPASLPIVKGFATREWEYWRTTITGVNSRFLPDESNPEEKGVHKFGAMFGEWNELVMYQANCNRFFGLNCICDYFKNFYKGSALGYAMGRASGQVSMGNEALNENTEVQTEQLSVAFDQFKYKKNADKSDVASWNRILNTKEGGLMFPGLIGKKIAGAKGQKPEANWPGNGGFRMMGLDNAKRGDIIIWDSNKVVAGGHKRPLHAAYVERTMDKPDGSKCIQVSESNNGVIRDSAGNTENWGRVTTRWLCNQDDQAYTFNQDGRKGLKDCANTQMSTCWEKQWSEWTVYRYTADTQRVTDPKTGEVKDAGSCQTDTTKFEQDADAVKGEQSGGWNNSVRDNTGKIDETKKNQKIRDNKILLKKMTDYGCPPPAKYILKDRQMRGGGITTGQYIPTAPSEPVALFDFIYNIRLDSIFKLWDLFPKPQIGNGTQPKITFKNNPQNGSSGGGASSSSSSSSGADKTCGIIALEYADMVKHTSGIKYKEGCAGNQSVGGSSASCDGYEFGRYGLIYAAYNNDLQAENVDGLYSTAPAHALSGGGVAYKNTYDNKVYEPGGCRITNLKPCAKAGDIVMVQVGNGNNRLTPYNRFLIYDGSNKFFEVQSTGAVVNYGSLPGEYANASYEVRHLSCNE